MDRARREAFIPGLEWPEEEVLERLAAAVSTAAVSTATVSMAAVSTEAEEGAAEFFGKLRQFP